jgi:ABC-type multidrug transport system ATPase subunit
MSSIPDVQLLVQDSVDPLDHAIVFSNVHVSLSQLSPCDSILNSIRRVFKHSAAPDKKPAQILNGVSGQAYFGHMTAIMGESGCGKTTLLDLLSGRLETSTTQTTHGSVTVCGQPLRSFPIKKTSGYVIQDDIFLGFLTPRETLTFAAQLKLPHNRKELVSV